MKAFARRFPLVGRWKNAVGPVFMCLSVCPSNFASGALTARRIETGEYSFDAPERRKDDGSGFGPISSMWHVQRAIAQTIAKKI